MNVKHLLVFASAAAMPFAAAFAQNNAEPGGPQGTGWYGNASPFSAYEHGMAPAPGAPAYGAAPPAGTYTAPPAGSYRAPSAGGTVAPGYERGTEPRAAVREDRRARMLNGFSADTNPPVPAP